jgi:NAD(P)-dependent dehydrogenase (short-subunit alcohol dehydrogenase family)
MPPDSEVLKLLRPGLLEGSSTVVAGAAAPATTPGSFADAVTAALRELGADVRRCELAADDRPALHGALGGDVERALEGHDQIDALVVDARAIFAAAGAGRAALARCLQATWELTREVASEAFVPAGAGRIIYLAPAPAGGAHAGGARAGLENLCRTLSIEWARHGITTVTVAPGQGTSAGEVGALVGYLCSPAGAYFSGCLLDLGGVVPSRGR